MHAGCSAVAGQLLGRDSSEIAVLEAAANSHDGWGWLGLKQEIT